MSFFKNINIAFLEHDTVIGNKEANLAQIRTNLEKMPKGIDILVLPELFSTGLISMEDNAISLAEKNTDVTIRTLKQISKQYNLAITGSFLARTSNKIYNRAFFIESSGEEFFYDKRHLHSEEMKIITSGNKLPSVIRYRGCNIMLSIGEDLKFPVWLRNSNYKYDLLLLISKYNNDITSNTFLTTRAIENTSYVSGNMQVIDFEGKLVSQNDSTSSIIYGTIDTNKLNNYRENCHVIEIEDKYELKI